MKAKDYYEKMLTGIPRATGFTGTLNGSAASIFIIFLITYLLRKKKVTWSYIHSANVCKTRKVDTIRVLKNYLQSSI